MNRIVYPTVAILMVALAGSPAPAQAGPVLTMSPDQVREQEAFSIGVQAYIWAYPLEEVCRTMKLMTGVSKPEGIRAPVNRFGHARQLITPAIRDVVRPNNDTLYSIAWLDLDAEPIVLHVPKMQERYYVFQMLDAYTNVVANIGRRTVGSQGGNFAVTGPGWEGELPQGVKRIESPTPIVWVIGRTLVEDEADLPNVIALQDRYALTPLSAFGKAAIERQPIAWTAKPGDVFSKTPDGLEFFELVGTALQKNPPPDGEAGLLALFGRIGLSVEDGFSSENLDSATIAGLLRATAVARQLIQEKVDDLGVRQNGWSVNFNTGKYGYDYLLRAAVAKFGLGANIPQESMYPSTSVDGDGSPLTGEHRYVIRFPESPPVDAFWSVTIYDADSQMLVENPIHRFSIGDRTKGLQRDRDGSVTIHVQHESPGKDKQSNWLPAPDGQFTLTLRAYNPKPELLDGKYVIPPVRRVK